MYDRRNRTWTVLNLVKHFAICQDFFHRITAQVKVKSSNPIDAIGRLIKSLHKSQLNGSNPKPKKYGNSVERHPMLGL